MYRDLKRNFWWSGMKRDVEDFVARCLNCQKVKAEHQRPSGWLQPLDIPEWKWEHITMDFVTGLPRTRQGHDFIWVIVDRLAKSAHFIPVRTTYTLDKLVTIYIEDIVRLHGIPVSIVSDRDPRFTSQFWNSFQQVMGTKVKLSTRYQPQTDGQTERTIPTLEDMLRACILDFQCNWGDYVTLIEFSYNNSYHSSIGMAPYEALYGKKCRSPLCWDEVGEKRITRPKLVQLSVEKVIIIRQKLKEAQDRQKSWANIKRRSLEFHPGDKVYLRVSPTRGLC
ncbi:UNVERIFIED_CONTAM: Transposon Ty3-I Gag-Pol polyprotein [Sesamum latifolium]|uniref:Transposon Ty3-I Gag-Pol polyprotein n=1 Tax=Sesamum latifolium TaxID=2727402 RepID=A0AAW2U388_9LAMI